MKLKELILTTNWNEIEQSFYNFFPEEDEFYFYKRMLFSFYEMKPVENKEKIAIHIQHTKESYDDIDVDEEFWSIEEVRGISLESFSIAQWLDFEVLEVPKELSYADFIAHCLWEISFYSFNQLISEEQSLE